tara:strand:+ start:7826 stop:8590 length:765 start_codon:yes stop_codon:yes gene_type:complete
MQMQTAPVKSTLAVLNNVSTLHIMVRTLLDRAPQEPGLGVFFGYSGLGKTYASTYSQNKFGAARLEVGDSWSRKYFLTALLKELGEQDPKGSIPDLLEQAAIALDADPERPLLIDEADKLVDKKIIELVRELHDKTGVPIVLIGEEQLPYKLQRWERVHNRVLRWEMAQPCDAEDTRALAKLWCDTLTLSDDLIEAIRRMSEGRARRIVVNLSLVEEVARNEGVSEIDLATFEKRVKAGQTGWFTATPPRRGKA